MYMIKFLFKTSQDADGYIQSSTIECRLFGILLYKKVYLYPSKGWDGEYFKP